MDQDHRAEPLNVPGSTDGGGPQKPDARNSTVAAGPVTASSKHPAPGSTGHRRNQRDKLVIIRSSTSASPLWRNSSLHGPPEEGNRLGPLRIRTTRTPVQLLHRNDGIHGAPGVQNPSVHTSLIVQGSPSSHWFPVVGVEIHPLVSEQAVRCSRLHRHTDSPHSPSKHPRHR